MRNDGGESGPFSKWLRWGHIGATVALASLVYNFWKDARDATEIAARERVHLEARIVALETALQYHGDAVAKLAGALSSTMEATREDLRAMNATLMRHADRDRERPR